MFTCVQDKKSMSLLTLPMQCRGKAQGRLKYLKNILNLPCWYSLDSSCWVLSDEYPCARVKIIFQVFASFCIGQIATSSNIWFKANKPWPEILMPGSQAWDPGSSPHWIPISRLAWSLYKCVALWRAYYGTSATKRPMWREGNCFTILRFYLIAIWLKLLKACKNQFPPSLPQCP